MNQSGCLVLNNNIKYRSSGCTGGSVLTAQKSFVLWFEASYLQKVILIKPTNFLCNELVANELNCLKFEFLRRTRMKKRASSIQFPLTFLPLEQKWMQTLLGKSRGKISLILFFGLCNQNVPMSNWARFTVLLVTVQHCFLLALDWGWLHSTFGWSGVMLISSRSVVSGFELMDRISSQIAGLRSWCRN